jgi:hypothetical protein
MAQRQQASDPETPQSLMRQSCFKWLLGDAPKSRALFYYVQATDRTGTAVTGNTPFEEFMVRLRDAAGIDLMAHRERLAMHSHHEQLAGRSAGSGLLWPLP